MENLSISYQAPHVRRLWQIAVGQNRFGCVVAVRPISIRLLYGQYGRVLHDRTHIIVDKLDRGLSIARRYRVRGREGRIDVEFFKGIVRNTFFYLT